jgi:hypothetical protein
MNEPSSDPQLDALFAAARTHRPVTARAEYAFETRLLARLRETRFAPAAASAWGLASWRLIPFLGLFVLGLVLWQDQAATVAQEAEQVAYVQNPDAADLCNGFN